MQPVLERLKAEQMTGSKTVLVSAAIDPPIVRLSRMVKCDYLSSQLRYNEKGEVVGLATDLYGRKAEPIRSYLKHFSGDFHKVFYSDNLNDLPLMRVMDKGIFVSRHSMIAQYVTKHYPEVEIISV